MTALSSSPVRGRPLHRLEWLCDPGSLELLGDDTPGLGVVPVAGRVGGRPVLAYAQDATVSGGSVGVAEADAIVAVLRRARRFRVPVVALIESAGARLQDGTGSLAGYGRIFFENVALTGRVPQISVITNTAAGGGCYSPALTDFVVMSELASMFLTGPRVVRHALGEDVTAAELGGAAVHERNGVCDLVAPDDRQAIATVRELLAHLPERVGLPAPFASSELPFAGDPAVALPAESRQFYDVREVISRIVDGGRLLEVSPRWARNMVTGLARLEGRAIGVVANQARHLGGIIDVEASQKAARFINRCDAFGLPLLVLVDTPGFMPGIRQESAGVIRHGASLVRAFAGATTPRVTVILRKAFGGGFIAMNSKDLGADAAFSWRGAEIGVMSSAAAVEIIHRRRLAAGDPPAAPALARRYAVEHLTAAAALARGAIDAIIPAAQTRERVSAQFAAAAEPRPARRSDAPVRAAREGALSGP